MSAYNKIAFATCCLLLTSCIDVPIIDEESNKPQAQSVQTRSASQEKKYERLANPYAIDVMQNVYDTFSDSGKKLIPTDLYIKFMPSDSAQLHRLKYEYCLELFDHPLDINLEEGDVYINTDIPETDLTWVYTTVKPDFVFPDDIPFMLLEKCYIPEDDETVGIATKGDSEINVEEAAFKMLGYEYEIDEAIVMAGTAEIARAKRYIPSGTIKVYDDVADDYVPLKGVKVRCNNFIKWATAYTDANGRYRMPKSYTTKLHYALVFDNVCNFDIWGNWGPIARANYNMGKDSSFGHSANIDKSNIAWEWAAVNNAAYEYYSECDASGITRPPMELKIWVFKNEEMSSAPMLRRIKHPIGHNGHSDWLNFLANIGYGTSATILNNMLRVVLPDITIGTKDKSYAKIHNTVNHELAHASHFRQVGSDYWAKYVSYIMTYGSYGDGHGKNAELCGIGEMWGYFMGNVLAHEKYNGNVTINKDFPRQPIDGWIYPHIFWDIYKHKLASKSQIYDCLTENVETYLELVSAICDKNKEKSTEIRKIFKQYIKTLQLEVDYDLVLENMNIKTAATYYGKSVLIKNVSVANSAKLIINCQDSIVIRDPFVVERGSEFEFI